MRCLNCDEPDIMYIPAEDIDDYGLYSCAACDFEIEGPSESKNRAPQVPHERHPLSRPIPIAVTGLATTSPYIR